jgi:hypothetical protein
MTKKTGFLIVLALLLGGLSVYLNRDRFRSDPIQISHRSMPPRGALAGRSRAGAAQVDLVVFMFSRPIRLTSLQVVLVGDAETNQSPRTLWELTADSRSAPVKSVAYGVNVPGMKPAVKNAIPEPLQPGGKYRLLIKAGSLAAEHDFTPAPRPP